MEYRLLAVAGGLLSAVSAGFVPTIQLANAQGERLALLPQSFDGHHIRDNALPQKLTVGETSDNMMPYFTAKPDNTISVGDWCVEADNGKIGDAVNVNSCNGGPTQQWNWIPRGNGQNVIQLKDTNLCLGVKQGSLNGAAVDLQPCGSETSASWLYEAPVKTKRVKDASFVSSLRHVAFCVASMVVFGMLGNSAGLCHRRAKTFASPIRHDSNPLRTDQGGVSMMKVWRKSHIWEEAAPAVIAIGAQPASHATRIHQNVLMSTSPSSMSPAAAVQYLLDMRHTALGAKFVRRKSQPLQKGDLQGKLVLVTGGTAGIGLAAARYMAAAGAEVHVTGRSKERGAAAVAVSESLDGNIIFHQGDLGSVTGAHNLATAFVEGTLRGRRIDIIVQNLAMMHAEHGRNEDGHELTLGSNLLNFYVLASTLLPHMATSGARMINVVSAGQHLYKLRLEELEVLNATGGNFDGVRAYSLTHRARVLLSERWARSSSFSDVSVASVHPGWVETPGLREAAPMAAWYAVMKRFLRSEAEGADTIAWLASPSTPLSSEAFNGGYFWDRKRRPIDLAFAGTATGDEELDRIMAWLEKITKL